MLLLNSPAAFQSGPHEGREYMPGRWRFQSLNSRDGLSERAWRAVRGDDGRSQSTAIVQGGWTDCVVLSGAGAARAAPATEAARRAEWLSRTAIDALPFTSVQLTSYPQAVSNNAAGNSMPLNDLNQI
jgi:hypothetical protein